MKSSLLGLKSDSVELPELLRCFEPLRLSGLQSLFLICDLQQLFEAASLAFSKQSLKGFEQKLDARLKPVDDFDDDFELEPKDPKKKEEFEDDFTDVKKEDLDFKDPLDDYNF